MQYSGGRTRKGDVEAVVCLPPSPQLSDLKVLCTDADGAMASLAHQELDSAQTLLREREESLMFMLLPQEEDADRAAIVEVC